MQFQKGQSGNPAGRPRGARNRQTIAAEKLFADDAEVLARVAIDLAKAGDMAALRLCLDRICAPHRHRPTPFDLPQLGVAADAVGAMSMLMEAGFCIVPGIIGSIAGAATSPVESRPSDDISRQNPSGGRHSTKN